MDQKSNAPRDVGIKDKNRLAERRRNTKTVFSTTAPSRVGRNRRSEMSLWLAGYFSSKKNGKIWGVEEITESFEH